MEKSMFKLREEIISLAVEIGYHTKIVLNDEDERFVWELIDFGYSEDNVMAGKCSIQATLDFDMEKWNKQMILDLERLKKIKGC